MNVTDALLEEIDKGRQGTSKGIEMGLDKLEGIIDGVTRGTYTCVMAQSSVGKSSIVLYAYVYRPLMANLGNPNFKITFFALEQTAPILMSKLLSTYIYEKYKKQLGYKELLSRKKNFTLSDEDYRIVKECEPWMRAVEKQLTVYDKGSTPELILKKVKQELAKDGEFNIDGDEYSYTPKDQLMTHLFIVDHLNLLTPGSGRSIKQAIDLLSHNLMELRNKCNISPIVIMQSNRDGSSTARAQLGDLLPKLSDARDTSSVSDDVDIFIALFDPNRARLATHNGYDVKALDGKLKSIVVLKNRYGENQVEDCCIFYGKINIWKECPYPEKISNYSIFDTPNWSNEDFDKVNTGRFSFDLDDINARPNFSI